MNPWLPDRWSERVGALLADGECEMTQAAVESLREVLQAMSGKPFEAIDIWSGEDGGVSGGVLLDAVAWSFHADRDGKLELSEVGINSDHAYFNEVNPNEIARLFSLLDFGVHLDLDGQQTVISHEMTGIWGLGQSLGEAITDLRAALQEHLDVMNETDRLTPYLVQQRNVLARMVS